MSGARAHLPRVLADTVCPGRPCRKKPGHVELSEFGGYTLRTKYGKGNCVICERERIVQLVLTRKHSRIPPVGK